MKTKTILPYDRILLFVFVSLFFIFAGCSEQQKVLLFLGDSMMAGDVVDPGSTYPTLLERQMPGYKTIIQENTGWTSNSYLENWEEVEEGFPSNADFVFIQMGVSDLANYGYERTTITNCLNNTEIMMEKVKNHFPKAEIVLMSRIKIDVSKLNPDRENPGFNRQTNEYLTRMGDGYTIIAANKKYNFIDLHRQVPIQSTYDGIHLNENGHSIVANIITRFLREYISIHQDAGVDSKQ